MGPKLPFQWDTEFLICVNFGVPQSQIVSPFHPLDRSNIWVCLRMGRVPGTPPSAILMIWAMKLRAELS